MTESQPATTREVSGAALRWARERSLLGHADVAERLDLKTVDASTVEAWEADRAHPTPAQARALAKYFRIPAHWLYYATPPRCFDDLGVIDFRTTERRALTVLSRNLRSTIEHALDVQAWVASYRASNEAGPVELVGTKSERDDPKEVAEYLREVLDLERLRTDAANADDFFKEIRAKLEAKGVLVLRMGQVANVTAWALDPNEFRGFTLIDDERIAPLIFINRKDVEEAQLFTLGHELAHLVTGGSGVSNEDILNFEDDRPPLELFCDQVAEELVVPSAAFEQLWGSPRKRFLSDKVDKVAAELKVTPLVAGRRAVTMGRGTAHAFHRFAYDRAHAQVKKKSSGGNPYTAIPAWYGDGLVRLLASAATSGHPSATDALDLLSVKFDTARRLAQPTREQKASPQMERFPLIEISSAWQPAG